LGYAFSIPCDMLSFLSKKPYIADPSDLPSSPVRLIWFDATEALIRQAFECKCTRTRFQGMKTLPDPMIKALWSCAPDFKIIEAESNMMGWTDAQWEEVGIRVRGRTGWGEQLQAAGFVARFTGWIYDSTWTEVSDARPSIVVFQTECGQAEFRRRVSVPTDLLQLNGLQHNLTTEIRHRIIYQALHARDTRSYQRGYSAGESAGYDRGYRVGASKPREVLKDPVRDAVVEHVMVAGDLRVPDSFRCPLTKAIMKDATFNTQSHLSYERDAIFTWVLQHSSDPMTHAPTSVDDLFPNRALQDAIDSIK